MAPALHQVRYSNPDSLLFVPVCSIAFFLFIKFQERGNPLGHAFFYYLFRKGTSITIISLPPLLSVLKNLTHKVIIQMIPFPHQEQPFYPDLPVSVSISGPYRGRGGSSNALKYKTELCRSFQTHGICT